MFAYTLSVMKYNIKCNIDKILYNNNNNPFLQICLKLLEKKIYNISLYILNNNNKYYNIF